MKLYCIVLLYLFFGYGQFSVHSVRAAKPSAARQGNLTRSVPVIFHACPSWCFPRGHSEQYRFCYDRPFAPGDEPDYVWQLRTMKEAVPESALAVYCFVNEKRTVNYWLGVYEKYLDAATATGTRVLPSVHAISPEGAARRSDDLVRLTTALLNKYGTHPAWFQWNGRPMMLDYGSGGLRKVEDLSAALCRIRNESGTPFFYVTEPLSDVTWAVKGEFTEDYIRGMLHETDGIYHFTQPLDPGLQGYRNLGAEIRKAEDGRIYGAGIQPGYYSARKNARNFVSSRGTQTLRKGFEASLAGSPDFLHIKTWNDWVEATSVEPSYAHTHALLDIISCFASRLNGVSFPEDTQPRVVVSYRKNIFPGETLDIKVLNLPVSPAFSPLR
jgi:hypothetical protein